MLIEAGVWIFIKINVHLFVVCHFPTNEDKFD